MVNSHGKNSKQNFVSDGYIRTLLTREKSDMYRNEVPKFGDLLTIIQNINELVEAKKPGTLESRGLSKERLTEERHGAIRLATSQELKGIAERFKICGMLPVDYYDLTVAGMPAHSTAFRPVEKEQLAENPYRVFTSVLKLDVLKKKIEDKIDSENPNPAEAQKIINEKWNKIEEVISNRKIFTDRSDELLNLHKKQGGFTKEQADEFVKEFLETFRWQKTAAVDKELYEELSGLYKIVGDVLGFKVPHINHLTPVTLDIDAAYEQMQRQGMTVIKAIQGPPKRDVPILLRQTSFVALTEPTLFPKKDATGFEEGKHTARFGEIEQRGVALTPKGRRMYDLLLDAAMQYAPAENSPDYKERYPQVLEQVFKLFPDSDEELRKQGLAYYYYVPTEQGKQAAKSGEIKTTDLEELISLGHVKTVPITYEDFLPFSAVGIFKSNLGDMDSSTGKNLSNEKIAELMPGLKRAIEEDLKNFDERGNRKTPVQKSSAQNEFETALGDKTLDPFKIYEAAQARSIKSTHHNCGGGWRKLPVNENVRIRKAIEQDPTRKIRCVSDGGIGM